MKKILSLFLTLVLFTGATSLTAQDEPPSGEGMPPMGPPPEMQELTGLVGTWDVVMKSKWDPNDTVWTETKGVCEFKFVAGGAALMMDYRGEMMGMPFEGLSIECFDRETGKWQSVWTDNVGARITLYEGVKEGGKVMMVGEEMWQGQKSLGRITTYNLTDNSFDWMMESSLDGGETFAIMATAKYTKRQ
ncbi:MAG: DUF1579 family protein [candidate division Zixibacteria bacterium]|nr:DUF1579 family protein [candidate division Zixibacteria bacterium]